MEQEVKLTAPDGDTLEQISLDADILKRCNGAPWTAKPLVTTYLDTPGRALLAHGFGFRFRIETQTQRWQACLKGEGNIVDGFSVRQEWEQPIDGPVDRLSLLPEGPLRQQVLTLAPGGEFLAPLVETAFLRRLLLLTLEEGCIMELALDQGEIRAGGKTLPLFEVELECKSGPTAPMLRFSHALRQRYPLIPSWNSKFALGLTLLTPRP
ncbi:MAG: CYTH domain-containing protein [Magnetococcales bacterium]|nr:CYTH domain-containing protein [Magnetococcales bacterium]MBF0349018.1 CYTH domain-containing protein [Magnetococcales bacterium]MBF0630679.1 CYTH domain-containing protein [Magnetococcales bacterium]